MFVPKAGGRSTRRRPRTSSDDSVKPPKAKRQRSVLRRPDESPSDTSLGREVARLSTPTLPNGDTPTDPASDSHLVSRITKQGEVSGSNEGAVVLVSCDIISQTPRADSQARDTNARELIVKHRFLHRRPIASIARSNSRVTNRYRPVA